MALSRDSGEWRELEGGREGGKKEGEGRKGGLRKEGRQEAKAKGRDSITTRAHGIDDNFSSLLREKKQLASMWTREQEEELAELFQRYKHEDGEGKIKL